MIFYRASRVSGFYCAMSAGRQTDSEARAATVAADGSGDVRERGMTRRRRNERLLRAARMAVVLAPFPLLVTTALLAGGHRLCNARRDILPSPRVRQCQRRTDRGADRNVRAQTGPGAATADRLFVGTLTAPSLFCHVRSARQQSQVSLRPAGCANTITPRGV
jgi:hypothetical protein